MQKQKIVSLLIILLLIAFIVPQIALAAWWNPFSWGWVNRIFHFQQTEQKSEKLIGGDKDSHGCLIAAGYSWCEVKNKCLRTWEEKCEKVVDPTTGWKTYTNLQYGYTIKYPSDWTTTLTSDGSLYVYCPLKGDKLCTGLDGVGIGAPMPSVYVSNEKISLEDYKKGWSNVHGQENYLLDRINGWKFIGGSEMGVDYTIIFVTKNSNNYIIRYPGSIDIQKQIISTFKFAN